MYQGIQTGVISVSEEDSDSVLCLDMVGLNDLPLGVLGLVFSLLVVISPLEEIIRSGQWKLFLVCGLAICGWNLVVLSPLEEIIRSDQWKLFLVCKLAISGRNLVVVPLLEEFIRLDQWKLFLVCELAISGRSLEGFAGSLTALLPGFSRWKSLIVRA